MPELSVLDGDRLRAALVGACDSLQQHRADLNRINVFPVPDGDTGTNLALTAGSIADHLRDGSGGSIGTVAAAAADAAILGARGNCGMILSHYLLGFAEAVAGVSELDAAGLARALRAASTHVYDALEEPVEGTIITVMRGVAEAAERDEGGDLGGLLTRLAAHAREVLLGTPDQLPALKAAGVVDAGAKGFTLLLDGLAAHLSGREPPQPGRLDPNGASPAAAAVAEFSSSAERYRFCTEALVKGSDLPEAEEVRSLLRAWGDSLVVIRSGELLKVHLHTDDPERVMGLLRRYGTLAAHKAEDMRAQHAAIERAGSGHLTLARRPISIVTDSGSDLPEEVVRAHGIHVVPLALIVDDRSLRDGIDITSDGFVELLERDVPATTSQPSPAAFTDAFDRAAEEGETIIAITLASALSGTFASAEAAAKRWSAGRAGEPTAIHVVDSRGASLTQGMLTLKAAELAEAGVGANDIVRELQRVRDRAGIYFTLDRYDRLLASGRVGRGRAMLGNLLDIKPVLGLDRTGNVVPGPRVRGSRKVLPRMLELIEAEIASAERVRFGVIEVGAEESAQEAVRALQERFGATDVLRSPASPVIATHTGIGTWGIAYQVED